MKNFLQNIKNTFKKNEEIKVKRMVRSMDGELLFVPETREHVLDGYKSAYKTMKDADTQSKKMDDARMKKLAGIK